jgi:type III secretory pathway component EscU
MTVENQRKPFSLKIARILLFTCAIAVVLILFYLSSINAISYNAYLISGFGVVIAAAIINYALVRIYGNRPPNKTA